MNWELLKPLLQKSISTLVLGLRDQVGHFIGNRILEYEAETYNRNYFVKTILHKINPVRLLEIYYPLQLQLKPGHSRYKLNHSERFEIKSLSDLFRDNQYITITGDAGSGKSTLIKYLFLSCLKEAYKIPITIELRSLNHNQDSFEEYIANQIFHTNRIGTSDKTTEQLLDKGKFLFFLDGYDEINSEKKESLTREINDFVRKYNKNSYLITSRPYTGVLMMPLFKNFWISKLSMRDVEGFIEKQMINEDIAKLKPSILNSIHSLENEGVYDFLSNPLLLSIFILTYEYNPLIPQKKSLYYQQVFDALFSTHDSLSKFGYVRDRRCKLNKTDFEKILQQFSAITYFQGAYTFHKKELSLSWATVKSTNSEYQFEDAHLMYDLTTNIGLIVEDGLNYYFAHRSLQEYFAAQYISMLDAKNKSKIYRSILKKIDDPKSKEIMNFISILKELDESYFLENLTIPHLRNIQKQLSEVLHPFDFFSNYVNFIPPIFAMMLGLDNASSFIDYLINIRASKQKLEAAEKLLSNLKANQSGIDDLAIKKPKEMIKSSALELIELKKASIAIRELLIDAIDEKIEQINQFLKRSRLKNSEIVDSIRLGAWII